MNCDESNMATSSNNDEYKYVEKLSAASKPATLSY